MSNNDEGTGKRAWDTSRVRREGWRDVAKKIKNKILEMEEFVAGMRRWIQHHALVLTKEDGA